MAKKYEEVHIYKDGEHQVRGKIIFDRSAEARRTAFRISSIIWVLFGIIVGLIGVRIVLKLIAANPENIFAQFIYGSTEIFLWPFYGLLGSPSANGMVLEVFSLVAVLVYTLLGWAIVNLVWLLLYRS